MKGREGERYPEAGPEPTRWPLWWPVGLSLLALLLGVAIWHPFPPGVWHDDGVYVLLGRALARGEGLRYVGVVGSLPAPKYPPLYPLLLAGVWRVWPAFPENASWFAGLNLFLLAAAAGLFAAYAQRVLRLKPALALFVAALAWISPSLWRTALVSLSEPLFLLLLIVALWAGALMEEDPRPFRVVLFLLAGAAAYYTRTAGVAVLFAGVVALLFRRRLGLSLCVLGGSLAVALPWALWSRRAAASIPASLQDLLGPYGGWLAAQVGEAPWAFIASLPGSALQVVAIGLSLHLPGVLGSHLWLGLPLVPICLWGLVVAARSTLALPVTLLVSMAILAVWPIQMVRLVAPLHPLLILGTSLGFHALWTSWRGRLWPRRALAGLGATWLLVMVPVSIYRLASGWTEEPYRVQSVVLMEAVGAVEENTPPDAVVGAPELWAGIHLFTGRTVVPSAPFRPFSGDDPTWGTPEEQIQLWREAGVTHLVVEQGGMIHGEALDRIDALCPPGTVQLLFNQPGLYLVRLAWDRSCQEKVLAQDTGP